MLRFPRDRLHVGIEPDRLSLVRLSELMLPTVTAHAVIPFPAGAAEATIVDMVAREILTERWRGTRATLLISDRLVHYFIAKRPSGTRNVEELQQAASLRFEEIYGVDIEAWEIRMDFAPMASRYFGCACPKTLFAGLLAAFRAAAIPVKSIAPFTVSEFNRHHRTMGGRHAWLAVVGRGHLLIARRSGRNWFTINLHSLHEDVATELPRILSQERLRSTLEAENDTAPVWISGHLGTDASHRRLSAGPIRTVGSRQWPDQTDKWAAAYRFALSPVWPTCA